MKKETFFLICYAFWWIVLIDIVAVIININEDLLHTEAAEYLLFVSIMIVPVLGSFGMVKLKLYTQKRCENGNQDKD